MNTIDDRLSRMFGAIDTPSDFETLVMARVHAADMQSMAERANSAQTSAQQSHDTAARNLRQWYRAALRMLTLDGLGAATLLVVLMAEVPRVSPRLASNGSMYALSLIALIAAVVFIGKVAPQLDGPVPARTGQRND